MIKNIFRNSRIVLSCAFTSAILFSCSKNELIDAAYPDQSIYLAEAAVAVLGSGANGIYPITPNITNQVTRFKVEMATSKVNITLGVIRSGVTQDGNVTVSVGANSDTIAKLIASGKLVAGTELLPATAYTLPASVTVQDGKGNSDLPLMVDLNFLQTNLLKKYAVAVAISNPTGKSVNSKLTTAIIYIEPAQILLPVANFTNYVFNDAKTGNFDNVSGNGVTYSWNFGDSSPISSEVSPSHKYAASGTYTVTLTTTGVTGATSVKSTSITIL